MCSDRVCWLLTIHEWQKWTTGQRRPDYVDLLYNLAYRGLPTYNVSNLLRLCPGDIEPTIISRAWKLHSKLPITERKSVWLSYKRYCHHHDLYIYIYIIWYMTYVMILYDMVWYDIICRHDSHNQPFHSFAYSLAHVVTPRTHPATDNISWTHFLFYLPVITVVKLDSRFGPRYNDTRL